jgi:hypothetical protein
MKKTKYVLTGVFLFMFVMAIAAMPLQGFLFYIPGAPFDEIDLDADPAIAWEANVRAWEAYVAENEAQRAGAIASVIPGDLDTLIRNSGQIALAPVARTLLIFSPVDVFVYDVATNRRVVQIIDNIVQDVNAQFFAYINTAGVKSVILPALSAFRVELVGTDTGLVNVMLEERRLSGRTITRMIGWHDLPVVTGDALTLTVPAHAPISTWATLPVPYESYVTYILAGADGEIAPTSDLAEDEVVLHRVTVESEPAHVGLVSNSETFAAGMITSVNAMIFGVYYEFIGWFEDDTLISTYNSYRFRVTEDRTLVARFAAVDFNDGQLRHNISVENLHPNIGIVFGYGLVRDGTYAIILTFTFDEDMLAKWYENDVRVWEGEVYAFPATHDRHLTVRF